MRKFTEVLEEYLEERDNQNSDYYDNRFISSKLQGQYHLEDLAKELNEMVQGLEE